MIPCNTPLKQNALIHQVLTTLSCSDWLAVPTDDIRSQAIQDLEQGKILLFPTLPFTLFTHEQPFLSPEYVDPNHKNISFDPKTDLLRGTTPHTAVHHQGLKKMLQRYAHHTLTFINQLLPTYRHALQIGRTSFRPIEISGRISSYRKDDTRLHVDAFPATPNQGRRILRVFTNINPGGQPRVWRVGEPFETVANKFLPRVPKPLWGSATLLKLLKITKSCRTEYDHIMLHIHDHMKADLTYQKNAAQHTIDFFPGNSWIVQTDHVSHAAMSGQHLLEQTFYLPVNAMHHPQLSPICVLEKITNRILA